MGGPGIMGMWPPMGGLIPGAGPTGIIPGGGGPSLASWEGLPCGAQASCQAEEGQGDWGEVGSWPLQVEEQRTEREGSSLVEMQPLSCQSGSGPALPSISGNSLSHSLCVSDHCSVPSSQTENHG